MANTQQLYVLEFDDLPVEITRWLRSAEVDSINEQLATRYQLSGEGLKAVPFVTTWLAMGYIAPEETIGALKEDFALTEATAVALAGEMQKLIFSPIKIVLREKLGFVVDAMTTRPAPKTAPTPASNITPARKTTVAPPAPATPHPATPPEPQVARARVTVLARPLMTDIKKAAPRPAAPPTPSTKKPGPATISTEKPFGFTEVPPTPPPHTEVAAYEDHHPVVE